MSCEHGRRLWCVDAGKKLERQAAFGVLALARHRKPQAQQRIQEPPFRDLQAIPRFLVPGCIRSGITRVRRHELHSAFGSDSGNRPSCIRSRGVVLTQAIAGRLGASQWRSPFVLADWFERADQAQVGQVRERMPAIQARDVLEEYELLAMVAMEALHGPLSTTRSTELRKLQATGFTRPFASVRCPRSPPFTRVPYLALPTPWGCVLESESPHPSRIACD